MGFVYSKLACVDKVNKCSNNTPMSFQDLIMYNRKELGKNEIKNKLCNNKQGEIINCCDVNDTDLLNTFEAAPIKTFKNKNGIIEQIQICRCSGNSEDLNKCKNKYCQGFKQPS